MRLIANSHGKARIRVMRVERGPDRQQVREASLDVMLHGEAFAPSYTDADNTLVVATDTIRNLVNLLAREHITASTEHLARAVATRFLDRYDHVERVTVAATETRWSRLTIDGATHPHAFTLNANGHPTAHIDATRDATTLRSGIEGITFLKSTGSGFAGFLRDDATTLPETHDRIAATSMNATWLWRADPADHPTTNTAILDAMLRIFATTHSASLQDSLYRMGKAALEIAPEISAITLACPNKHYLPIDLTRLGAASDNLVFTPTDEPHGQIECTLSR